MNLKKNGKVFTSKFVGTGSSSYEKRIYQAAVSRRLRNTVLEGVTPRSFVPQTFQTKLLYPPSVQKKECLALKMEAVGSSETSVPIYQVTRHITEGYDFN